MHAMKASSYKVGGSVCGKSLEKAPMQLALPFPSGVTLERINVGANPSPQFLRDQASKHVSYLRSYILNRAPSLGVLILYAANRTI